MKHVHGVLLLSFTALLSGVPYLFSRGINVDFVPFKIYFTTLNCILMSDKSIDY